MKILLIKISYQSIGTTDTYTPDGKLASRIWARGITTSYAYDGHNQLTGIQYSDSTPAVSFAYDAYGRQLSAIVDGVSTNRYTYSGLDLVAENQNGTTLNRLTDNLGRPAGINLADSPYSITYGYDVYGRFQSVESAQSVVTYSWLLGSDLIAGYTQGDFTRTVHHEANRDLIAAVSNRFNTATISSFDYQNNAAGQRTQRIDNAAVTNNFGYNIRQEVISATMGADNYAYAYDPIGNRVVTTENTKNTEYLANNLNQYTSISALSASPREPLYDLDGNMTYDGAEWHYIWNGENRMICASNATHVVVYAYDHQGRMVWKSVATLDTPTETMTYLWDDYNIIAEKVGRTVPGEPPITTYNIWGLDLSDTLQGAGGVGGLLAVIRGSETFTAAYDANGNITEYVATNGTIAAHYEYSPFGEITVQSGSLASTFTHRFSTKLWCPVTGLSEYEYRKYRPNIGRWLSRDPIGERGGVNLYGFVGNDGVNKWDYLGLAYDNTGVKMSESEFDSYRKNRTFKTYGEKCDPCCESGSVEISLNGRTASKG